MRDGSHGCTSIDAAALTRLIAAARVTDAIAWQEAHGDAEREVAALWGGAGRSQRVDVSTEVLLQLMKSADAAITPHPTSDAAWARQVGRDLEVIVDRFHQPRQPPEPADA